MKVKVILFIFLTAFTITTYATDYYLATADLTVRTGAGKRYAVSYTVEKGEEVEVLSKNGSWYKIKYGGQTGYAYSKYLRYSRNTSDKYTSYSSESPQDKGPWSYLFVAVIVSILLFVVGFIIYRNRKDQLLLKTVTHHDRGTSSERQLVLTLLKHGIPEGYIFHDLYLKKENGHFSQIDLVLVSKAGIIVFEVKDYSGWIFGKGNQEQWTKVLAYGREKYRFYNPVRQNNGHITELKKQLKLYEIPFYSIVVFYGNCVLKDINYVPQGSFIVKSNRVLEAVRNIEASNKTVTYVNENEIAKVLQDAVANGAIWENKAKHNENLKDMLGKHRVFD